jgi:predicted secreted hydrolase
VRLLANPLYAAHFAVTDITAKQFRYEHRKSFNRRFDLPAETSPERYRLNLGDWTIRESKGKHILHATLGNNLIFDAALDTTKPAVLNGHKGISRKDESEASYHFSFTRMSISGKIQQNGTTENFSGSAWMDREFGTWYQKNWDWFSIQLNDDSELMIYQFRNESGEPTRFSHGALIDRQGRDVYLGHEDFTVEPLDFWKSPHTQTIYPSAWRLKIPRFDIELQIAPTLKNQELDTRGTTMIVYWEGACEVIGKRGGKPTRGRAYAELVGYDRSHENPSLSRFLLNDLFRKGWRSVLRKCNRRQIF